jgi:hypothetical protein
MNKLLAALCLLAAPLAFAEEPVKVAVVPFAPLGGDVPSGAGTKAAEVLVNTLKTHDGMAIQDAAMGAADDPAVHARKAAELTLTARKELESGQPHAARALLTTALAEFTQGAAALDDAEPVADAHAALSRALFQVGEDALAEKELLLAEALHPGKEFAEARTSPLFASRAAQAQQRAVTAEKGALRIGSIPAGASAKIDGLEAGRTPVQVRDLLPGAHVWRVDLPAGGSVGGVVEVAARGKAEVMGAALGKGPAAALVGQLASNQLPATALGQMKAAAAGLDAQLLVFGGLHVEHSELVFDGFVYSAKQNVLARLPRAKFDPDLVSAGQELAKVAAEVAGRASSGTLGVATSLPVRVAEGSSAELVEVSEFRFPAPGGEVQVKKETGPRKVVGARHAGPVTKVNAP